MACIQSPRHFCACLAALTVAVLGCGRGADQRLDKALEQAGQKREAVFPLAGHVTIENLPPEYDPRNPVVVVLVDRKHIGGPPISQRFVDCDSDGNFAFSTYGRHDGVPAGSYLLAIAKLDRRGGAFAYRGPDQLHNLYNDPEQNAGKPEFQIEHAAP
jgi:hypothetical protein